MRNQKGQVALEAILLVVVLLGISVFAQNKLKQSGLAAKMVQGPWGKLSGMIECGVWEPCKGRKGTHPSTRERNLSFDPVAE